MPDPVEKIEIGKCTCMNPLAKFLLSSAIDDSLFEGQRRMTKIIDNPEIKESIKGERINELRSHLEKIRELRLQIQHLPDCP